MEHFTGVLDDTRPIIEKKKDWIAEEVMSVAPAKWRVVNENKWDKYSVRDQDGSGSCVANATAKMLEVKRYKGKGDIIQFSHAPIYKRRINAPSGGMIGANALDIAVKYSSCKETDMPSMLKNDEQIDSMPFPENYEDLNNWVKPNAYLSLGFNFDFETVASYREAEGAVLLFVSTNYDSWCKDIPVSDGKAKTFNHGIACVDNFIFNGVKYLLIEDSWGKFGKYNGQRLITKEFFENMYFAGILTDFKYDVSDLPEKYVFKNFMLYGQKSDDIVHLQDFLKSKGFFPTNQISTGYYGNITAKAVLKFQIANNVASLKELTDLQGKACRSKTLLALNK